MLSERWSYLAFITDITLLCRRIHRLYRACLHSLDGRPRSSFPVVALITSRPWSPTAQFTLKLGAFPGCRASALLIPVFNGKKKKCLKPLYSQEIIFRIVMIFDLLRTQKYTENRHINSKNAANVTVWGETVPEPSNSHHWAAVGSSWRTVAGRRCQRSSGTWLWRGGRRGTGCPGWCWRSR